MARANENGHRRTLIEGKKKERRECCQVDNTEINRKKTEKCLPVSRRLSRRGEGEGMMTRNEEWGDEEGGMKEDESEEEEQEVEDVDEG